MKEFNENCAENLIPIREISRLTGVNSVTLRAWERRYGLIKPSRTNKGHRLYSVDDVELIKKIQSWLERGLAIGKVSELLESGQKSRDLVIENIWQGYCAELLSIMAELNLGRLEAFFNEIFSVYPAALIADQLIAPVLDNLSQAIYGNTLKKVILENRLSEYLLMLTQRQRQQATGKSVAILQLNTNANPLLNVLLHYGLVMQQIKSELIGLMPESEMVFAVQQLSVGGLIVYNDSCTSLSDFQKVLMLLAQKISVPILVVGKLAPIIIDTEFPKNVHLASEDGQQVITNMLNNIFSESPSIGRENV